MILLTLTALTAVVWVSLTGRSLLAVWNVEWRVKEDWRGVARLVAGKACPDSRVFVNIGPGYAYRIGYYQPDLLERTQLLSTTPERPLPVVIAEQDLQQGDWVVVMRDAPHVFAMGVGGSTQSVPTSVGGVTPARTSPNACGSSFLRGHAASPRLGPPKIQRRLDSMTPLANRTFTFRPGE